MAGERFNPTDVFGSLVATKIRRYIESRESKYSSFDELLEGEISMTVPSNMQDEVRDYLEPMLEGLREDYASMTKLSREHPEARIISDLSSIGHVRWVSSGFRRDKERPSGAGWIKMG